MSALPVDCGEVTPVEWANNSTQPSAGVNAFAHDEAGSPSL